jgi:hypothetical protein
MSLMAGVPWRSFPGSGQAGRLPDQSMMMISPVSESFCDQPHIARPRPCSPQTAPVADPFRNRDQRTTNQNPLSDVGELTFFYTFCFDFFKFEEINSANIHASRVKHETI